MVAAPQEDGNMHKYKTLQELVQLLDQFFIQKDPYRLEYELITDEIIHFIIKENDTILVDKMCDIYDVSLYTYGLDEELKNWFRDQWYEFSREDFFSEPEQGPDITLGEMVMVTDPCYYLDTWCNGTLENVKPGTWHTETQYCNIDGWGDRCASILIWHESVPQPSKFTHTDIVVGVDSGQAGIVDYDYFKRIKEDENQADRWYDSISTHTYKARKLSPLQQYMLTEYTQLHQEYEDRRDNGETWEDTLELYRKRSKLATEYHLTEEAIKTGETVQFTNKTWTDKHSVMTSSGLGDGSYDCFIAKDGDQIVGIKIDYFYCEDEEDA